MSDLTSKWTVPDRTRAEKIQIIISELESLYLAEIEIESNWHFFYCVRPQPSYDYVLHEQEDSW